VNRKDFKSPAAGRVITTGRGYEAFIPATLPPVIAYDQGLVRLLSEADATLSELAGLGRHLPNPRLLIAPYVRQEALLSSRIEGTRATLAEVLREELAEHDVSKSENRDVQEVRNYVVAMERGIRRLGSLPLSLRLVREVHARLMQGVRGQHATPGEFRRSQNWIGAPGSTLETAAYVPPPPDELADVLGDWERFLHVRDTVPDLVQCALIHEQFEAIHPFLDGNGRVGRLLITLFLIERGRLTQPLLYLSAYFDAHRQDYYELLQRCRTHGDWMAWLRFFLGGVRDTAIEAVTRAGRLMALRERWLNKLRDSAKALILLDELFLNPFVTVARAQELLKVSNPTARQLVGRLQQDGLLAEVTGRDWGRLYVARPILRAIERADPAARKSGNRP
jgi:Fic family protein